MLKSTYVKKYFFISSENGEMRDLETKDETVVLNPSEEDNLVHPVSMVNKIIFIIFTVYCPIHQNGISIDLNLMAGNSSNVVIWTTS